ncbi:MAG: glycoside hydrolase family 2 TIM barrel-domain containing protein [Chitinophagaceae bacterium]
MYKSLVLFIAFAVVGNRSNAQDNKRNELFTDSWQFSFNKDDGWQPVLLPHTYNKDDMQRGKDYYSGDAYYRKIFSLPQSLQDKRFFLRFEGVGAVADIFMNGKYVTQHRGAYTAFAFEVTNLVHLGKSDTLLVKVNNAARKDVVPINMSLFPVYGGIYRPVWMVVTDKINFSVTDEASPGIYIRQHTTADNAQVTILSKIENKNQQPQQITIQSEILDKGGKTVAKDQRSYWVNPQGSLFAYDTLQVVQPHLWDGVNDPYLYSVVTTILQDGKELDRVQQPLGLRYIEMKAGDGVYLNGKRYPMYGVSRHQDWQGYGSALSNEQHRQDFLTMREMGVTTVRLAHYPQADYVYHLADSLGILVWSEIPFVNATSYQESENVHEQMREMIRQMGNHPCVFQWGMHNEVYSSSKDGHVPVLTRELNDIAKTEDPDRYTVSTSGYGEIDRPSNLAGDVQGVNRYYGWYEGKIADLDKWGDYLKNKFPEYKVMLAEYGADANIDQQIDTLPSAESIDPAKGQFYPENYQTETHVQQWAAILRHPNILASYIWNMFEFAVSGWSRGGVPARNLKGLVTFDRKRKKDAFYWYKVNWNPEPMLYLEGRRDSMRTRKTTTVQLFSNIKDIELKVNGKAVKTEIGVNDKDWLFKNIVLKKGKNTIEAKGKTSDGKLLSDTMYWYYGK